jgi:hypothetical protein
MRRRLIPLALAVGGALLTACGGGGHAASPNRAPSFEPLHKAAAGLPTRAQALAFAHAVNLTAADLPGFKISSGHESHSPRERRAEAEMLSCAGSKGPSTGLAQASSKDFQFKRDIVDLGVNSEVSVARTTALAGGELASMRSSHIRGCFSRYLNELFQGERFSGATLKPVSIQSGTPPAPGTTGSFGWRVTATLAVRRVNVHFYMDILGFVYGRARVTLFSSGALVPFPAAIQQRLFGLLLARAKAHRV